MRRFIAQTITPTGEVALRAWFATSEERDEVALCWLRRGALVETIDS